MMSALYLQESREERPARRNTALIVESLVLLVFLIASLAIITRLLVVSLDNAEKSKSLEHAVILATNAAERFTAQPASASDVERDGELTVRCEVTPERLGAGTLYSATITVADEDGEIYRISTSSYVSEVGA